MPFHLLQNTFKVVSLPLLFLLLICGVTLSQAQQPQKRESTSMPTLTTEDQEQDQDQEDLLQSAETYPRTPRSAFSIKLLRGIHAEDITGPILFYESLAALTFEFLLPDWIHQPDKLLIYDQKCSSDEITKDELASSYTCPVFYYLHQIRDQLQNLGQINRFKVKAKINANDHNHIPEFNLDDCFEHQLNPHFHTFSPANLDLENYTSILSKCVHGLLVKNEISKEFAQSTSSIRVPYALMIGNFLKEYFNFLPTEGRVDLATLLNTATTYNTLALMHFLAESTSRWKAAFNDCKMQTIPLTLISEDLLLNSLKKLNDNLGMKQMELVLPSRLKSKSKTTSQNKDDYDTDDANDNNLNLANLGHYFKEKLTDCVFTKTSNNQSLFVRILIPIKKQGTKWRHYRVKASPFIQNQIHQQHDDSDNQEISSESKKVCYIKQLETPKYFAVDKSPLEPSSLSSSGSTTVAELEIHEQNCDLSKSRFCLVKDRTESISNFKRSCVSKMLNKLVHSEGKVWENETDNENSAKIKTREQLTDLFKLCKLNCEGLDQFELPAFTRVASDTFSIVGRVNDTIVAQLDSRVKIINPVETGVLQVTLPCNGVLLYKQWRFYAREPCGSIYKLVQVQY